MKTSNLTQAAAPAIFAAAIAVTAAPAAAAEPEFNGQHYRGRGDVEYLRLLDTARRMFEPDPELQNLAMLYEPKWDGLVEGPTWDAWWIQNSYGTTYSILPLLREPFVTFLQHSQDLWFDQMGDGHRTGAAPPLDWVAPDGCLCDAARPGWIVYRQGDGRIGIHDWGLEFTAAGILLQSELLLIGRDPGALAHYLPRLERSANFIETRRDPTNNLFRAGPAGNLLAPSYAGWRRPDGSYGQAYLAGLSITYIAALDRLIELEKLAHNSARVSLYTARRDLARQGLPRLTTEEGYFIRSLDPDGVKHGVFGAQEHGYFEASPNHDAIAFRVAGDAQSERIYRKIASLPGLRPYDFILPNYPSYDDMYEKPEGLWAYGTWVNGGHWSTCEARMVLAYYRLGQFDDARRSMRRLLTFAERFRMDNPLTKRGSDVYQPNQPINLCYDTFGPAAAFMRGLFEYLYRADGLTLVPHIPPAIEELQQLDPVRFGQKKLFLTTIGRGPVTGVRVNGRKWKDFDPVSVFLPYDKTPAVAHIQILLGNAKPRTGMTAQKAAMNLTERTPLPALSPRSGERVAEGQERGRAWKGQGTELAALDQRVGPLREFHRRLAAAGLGDTPAAAHVQLALDCIETTHRRQHLLQTGKIKPLPGPAEAAADQSYLETAQKLCAGLDASLKSAETATDPASRKISRLWREVSH
ncbi:MAG: hypothetical protein ABSD29_06985 [Verrucomicrobiota bacterium]